MEIVYRNLSEIKPNPKNPRKGTKEAVEKLAESIKGNPKFFEARPILLSDRTGEFVIIGGERRSEAARLLGMETVPTILLSGLSESQEDEILIKDNTHAGVWDEQKLQAWGKEQLQGWNVDGVKWPKQEQTINEDNFNLDKKVKARCNPGDIWQLGEHRLMCGDSTDGGKVALLMNGAKADMVFTDPPYGYQYQSNFREKTPKMEVLKNDDRILNIMPIVAKLCEGWVFLCTTWKVIGDWLAQFTASRELTNMVVWSKGGGGLGDLGHTFITDYELILVSNGGRDITGKRLGSVWEIMRDSVNNYEHPTQKPVRLPATAIENVSNPGDSVLDLFGGSGSTLIAAEQLGRRCFMMELDPHYCDVIISRWEQLTGKKAKKITG